MYEIEWISFKSGGLCKNWRFAIRNDERSFRNLISRIYGAKIVIKNKNRLDKKVKSKTKIGELYN
jgi:hypothetical protein